MATRLSLRPASCILRSVSYAARYSTRPIDQTLSSQTPHNSTNASPSSTLANTNKTGSPTLPRRPKKTTLIDIERRWKKGEPISMLTAHDYASAHYIESSGKIDIALVGDSLAMVACGYDSTNRLGLEEILYHCRAVARGATSPFLVSDMPFGTYQGSIDKAVENAIRIIREGHMEAVKVEGGVELVPLIERLTQVGVPVMAHVGLTPQRSTALSGFRVQGKTAQSARKTYEDAQAVAKAGAFAIVLEAIPAPIAQHITESLPIPTIGIGAGPNCSGQVLVTLDMLGGFDRFVPKFVKSYLNLSHLCSNAITSYADDVKSRSFPEESQHTYPMPPEELQAYLDSFNDKPS